MSTGLYQRRGSRPLRWYKTVWFYCSICSVYSVESWFVVSGGATDYESGLHWIHWTYGTVESAPPFTYKLNYFIYYEQLASAFVGLHNAFNANQVDGCPSVSQLTIYLFISITLWLNQINQMNCASDLSYSSTDLLSTISTINVGDDILEPIYRIISGLTRLTTLNGSVGTSASLLRPTRQQDCLVTWKVTIRQAQRHAMKYLSAWREWGDIITVVLLSKRWTQTLQ